MGKYIDSERRHGGLMVGFLIEPCHEKNRFLPLRKQRPRSASQLLLLAFFRDCTDRFVSGLFGNLEDRFPPVAAQLRSTCTQFETYM